MNRIYANIIPPSVGTLTGAKMLINNAGVAWKEENFEFPSVGSNVIYQVEYRGEKYYVSFWEEFVSIGQITSDADPDKLAAAMGLPTNVSFGSATEFYEYRNSSASTTSSDGIVSGWGIAIVVVFVLVFWALASGWFS